MTIAFISKSINYSADDGLKEEKCAEAKSRLLTFEHM
jgi:hypothetical protein